MISKHAAALAAGLMVCVSAQMAAAQTPYPTRQIRVLVGFAPGGPTDVMARIFSQRMAVSLGQPVVIENRTGANGNVAAELTAKAPPDGYTMLYGTSALALSPALYKKLNYDAIAELSPIALTAVVPLVLAVHPSVPAKTLAEFIAYMKANPGKLNFASAGVGNVTHLGAALFMHAQGLQAVHVPFNGSAPAAAAVAGGHVHFTTDTVNTSQPLIADGQMRALAVMGTKRVAILPNTPTFEEAGIPNISIGAWQGFVVPAKTPAEIIARLNAAALEAVADKEVKTKVETLGGQTLGSTPQQYADFLKSETARLAEVVKNAGIKQE